MAQTPSNALYKRLRDLHFRGGAVITFSVSSLPKREQAVVQEFVDSGWLTLRDASPHEVPYMVATVTDEFRRGLK